MNKLRIFLADDHKLIREGLRMFVNSQADMEVIGEADNGREAVQLAEQLQPDVVVQVGYFRAGVLASKAYEQLDFHPVVIGTGGMSGDPKLRPEIGKLVAWQFAVTPFSGDLPAAQKIGAAFEKDAHVIGSGMLGDVVESFLRDAIEHRLDFFG